MARLTKDAPPRLHEVDYAVIGDSRKQNGVGVGLLQLLTDDGTIRLAINATVAELLRSKMERFLAGKDDEPS